MTVTASQAQSVLAHLRRHHFAVLSTSDASGIPASAGVSYGASSSDLVIYVMTRRNLQKARNIAENPNVSLVVPVPRRVTRFLPPATMQLRGSAELLEWDDPGGTAVFRRFWLGRRILHGYRRSRDAGERRICFIRITLEPVVHTYMLGTSVWQIWRRMESGTQRVVIDQPGR